IEEGKLKGYKKVDINRLFKANKYDYILVEGDGAKKKPIKAPRKTEPIVPEKTSILIGVVGMDSLGTKKDTKNVLGLEEFIKITGGKEGFIIDENDIIKLIENKNGLFKVRKARIILVLNKVNRKNLIKAEKIKMVIESNCSDFLEKVFLVEEFK
ncbi:MAG: selenium cofactor biosynthesis protein YqeC, partial [Bacillota bacterium]|nr:selenium cofactor biosynthesis protein YqeC [Bacillota bacterium]